MVYAELYQFLHKKDSAIELHTERLQMRAVVKVCRYLNSIPSNIALEEIEEMAQLKV